MRSVHQAHLGHRPLAALSSATTGVDSPGFFILLEEQPVTKNCDEIEKKIQDKGLTAPRVTPADIEANIASEYYFTAAEGARIAGSEPHPLDLLTLCVMSLKNGFTVTGESACASPENFDAELGRKIARQNAVSKIWPLMGYALKEKLSA